MTCHFTFEEETKKKQSWMNQEGRYRKMNIPGRRWSLQSVFWPTLGFKQNQTTSVRSGLCSKETLTSASMVPPCRKIKTSNYCVLFQWWHQGDWKCGTILICASNSSLKDLWGWRRGMVLQMWGYERCWNQYHIKVFRWKWPTTDWNN